MRSGNLSQVVRLEAARGVDHRVDETLLGGDDVLLAGHRPLQCLQPGGHRLREEKIFQMLDWKIFPQQRRSTHSYYLPSSMVLSIAKMVKKDLGCLEESLGWSVSVREVAVAGR